MTTTDPAATGSAPEPRPERRRWWRPTLSLRLRMLGWALLMLAIATLASVLVVRQVLLNQLDAQVTEDLAQEVSEFRRLADGVDPATGQPFGTDLAAIADTYLERNEPQQNEAVLVFVDGEFYGASSAAPYDLTREPALVTAWTSTTSSTYGETADTPAGPARWLVVPVVIDGQQRGHVVVAQFLQEQRADLDRAVRTMLAACLLVIAVVGAGGYLAMGRALRPLRAVTETARTIQETDLSRRIEVTGSDEVAVLARTFNAMVERLEQAFAHQQTFLRMVGHELRTPITIVRGHLELMGDDPEERRETVALVTDELDRMSRMVNDLLVLARAEQPDFLRLAEVDVAAMMTDLYAKASALGPRDWELGPVAEVTVRADRQRLEQAITQLAQNAVQFTQPGDRVRLSAQVRGEWLALAVSDTGVGIDPADQERIFELFQRAGAGRSRPEGVGLGLAIVRAIAVAHRGRVTVTSAPGEGATFTLEIPLDQQAARESGAR